MKMKTLQGGTVRETTDCVVPALVLSRSTVAVLRVKTRIRTADGPTDRPTTHCHKIPCATGNTNDPGER